jgi:hypothetical protein
MRGEVTPMDASGSRALWDIRGAIGNVKADTVILEGQFDFPGTTMADLATRIVNTAQRLWESNGEQGPRGVRGPRHPLATHG